jgi:hypothetical protein
LAERVGGPPLFLTYDPLCRRSFTKGVRKSVKKGNAREWHFVFVFAEKPLMDTSTFKCHVYSYVTEPNRNKRHLQVCKKKEMRVNVVLSSHLPKKHIYCIFKCHDYLSTSNPA